MATFRFRLEALLEMRRREERDRQLAVAELERERLRLENAIRSRHAAARSGRDDLRRALEPGRSTTMASVRLQASAALSLETQTQRLAIELAGVLKRLDEARERLLEAAKDRKAVEHLKAKRFEAWKREQNRREAAEQDDLVTSRAARRTLAEGMSHE